ncbi:MAG: ABC transporter permease [Gemmatimonadota bacterium]|nr:ABC transporter permease [Gemmatimonadota bacterium]
MDTLLQDLRYAIRKLLRTPGFTIVAVATLALAIGATTAIFSVVNGVLLKPLPFREPDRLVRVMSLHEGKAGPLSPLDFIDLRDQSRSFAGVAAFDDGTVNLTGTSLQPVRLNRATVGASFFALLGIQPQLGRAFTEGEDSQSAARVAILSDELWRGRFGSDRRVLGQTLTLNGNSYTVVGVAPPHFSFPQRAEIWTPLVFGKDDIDPENRGAHYIAALARLTPMATVESASRDLKAIADRLTEQFPRTNTSFSATAISLQERMVGNVRPALLAMMGAVVFVLLIACANVANLLLVRAASRETEIAVRTALGAGRGRLIRQLITESVLLSVTGAAMGAALASWAVDLVVAFGPAGLPRLQEVKVDGTVLAFTALVALVTGVLFGLIPAIHGSRPDVGQMLKENARGSSGRRGSGRVRNSLVVAEMALAVVLLVGAGLMIRSFVGLLHVDPGFRSEHVVTFNISLPDNKYPYDRQRHAFVDDVVGRLKRLPGTQDAAVVFGRPLAEINFRTVFDIAGRPKQPPGHGTPTEVRVASPDFFRAMGIRLVRGRSFDEQDRGGGPQVVMVNQEFVRRYFPSEDPLGKRITLGWSQDTAEASATVKSVTLGGEIIGVIADVKQFGLAADLYPMTYLPFSQATIGTLSVVVRSTADPALVESSARAVVKAVDADLPIFGLQKMTDVVSESLAQPRFYTLLLGAFAGIALLLAALGIYGVISYAVSQRTRELGIRIALGATRQRVVRLVVGQGLALTILGVILGAGAAIWLTRLIASLLFGVSASDPLTFVAVSVVLLGVAVLASWLPARRAARVDPVIAMRAE